MEGRSPAAAPLDRECDHLGLAAIREVAAVCVVVRAAGRRVETHRLLDLVLRPRTSAIAPAHLTAQANGGFSSSAVDVLAIVVVVDAAALAVEGGVGKVHRGVVRLVFVGAPAVQDRFAVACRSMK